MTIFETLNGGIPYADGTIVEPEDLNSISANARSNALAARTSWVVGEKASNAGGMAYLWSSVALGELLKFNLTDCEALRYGEAVDFIGASSTGVSNASWVPAGGTQAGLRDIEAVKLTDWTSGIYSADGGTGFASFTPTSTAGIACGPAYWAGGTAAVRYIPGAVTGTGDGYPGFLVGSGNSTWALRQYATTEQGPLYRIAGYYHGAATSRCVGVGATMMCFGDPLASVTWQSIPVVTDVDSNSLPGIAWDESRSLFVMTQWRDDDAIVVATSPTGETWTEFTATTVGAGTYVPTTPLLADIIVIDEAWFILRATRMGGAWGETMTLLCSLDAGASWTDMNLPAIEAPAGTSGRPNYGMTTHKGRLVVYTSKCVVISSVIALPAAVASEAL